MFFLPTIHTEFPEESGTNTSWCCYVLGTGPDDPLRLFAVVDRGVVARVNLFGTDPHGGYNLHVTLPLGGS